MHWIGHYPQTSWYRALLRRAAVRGIGLWLKRGHDGAVIVLHSRSLFPGGGELDRSFGNTRHVSEVFFSGTKRIIQNFSSSLALRLQFGWSTARRPDCSACPQARFNGLFMFAIEISRTNLRAVTRPRGAHGRSVPILSAIRAKPASPDNQRVSGLKHKVFAGLHKLQQLCRQKISIKPPLSRIWHAAALPWMRRR